VDPDSLDHGPGQTLTLIAVVMGHQNIGDPVDPHLAEVVEHATGAEIHSEGGPFARGTHDVDVAGVGDPEDAREDFGHRRRVHPKMVSIPPKREKTSVLT
jgi:hypothetical protein